MWNTLYRSAVILAQRDGLRLARNESFNADPALLVSLPTSPQSVHCKHTVRLHFYNSDHLTFSQQQHSKSVTCCKKLNHYFFNIYEFEYIYCYNQKIPQHTAATETRISPSTCFHTTLLSYVTFTVHWNKLCVKQQTCCNAWLYHTRVRTLNPLKCSGMMVTFKIVQCHLGLTYILKFWHSSTLVLRDERQSDRMSEINNVG